MKTFKHYNARSLKEAVSLVSKHNRRAKVNAGGTDLLGELKDQCGSDYPEAVINIKGIKGLDYIRTGRRGLKIGALTKLSDVVKSPGIKQTYSLLAQAAHSVASPNVRNMATVGGNLAQDVRCWYYRYPQQIGGSIECLRKGGRTCSALLGDNRYHSIFGAAPAAEGRCVSHCPAHINIPEYLRHLREGKPAEAARVLMDRNPIPAITGRICPVFCEPHCNRGERDAAVAIHSIERGVGDYILNHPADYFAPPAAESGKKIAIVGSGPAGLAAAFYIRKSGHQVTVYEKLPEPGGMLLYSIAPFRLPKEVVRKLIQALKSMGVLFKAGVAVDGQLAAEIQSSSDAVFVARGTWRSLRLDVPGERAQGVHYALDYLKRVNSGERLALGNKVIVIGGGSVAVDAARTARRSGSEDVHLVCLETRDLASQDRMLALDQEILQAEEEGITIHSSLGVTRITESEGRATGIETSKCLSVRDPDGTLNPRYDTWSSSSLQGDSIIVAIGQEAEPSPFAPGSGVFDGGDMVEGPSTVIQAVASARKAADEVEMLFKAGQPAAEAIHMKTEFHASSFDDIPRVHPKEIAVAERIRSIEVEDMQGPSFQEVETEAHRCINCGCLAVGSSDLAIALVALDASILTTKRTLPAQAFFTATATCSTVLEPDELIREIQIPRPPKGARQSYAKFTLRKPIDFAVVSVASVITVENGVCSDARITLGAVAPAPIRAKAAEAAIKGAIIDEDGAAKAAKLALADAVPLGMNAYKAEIARTLVKRSILGVSC
jgi:NADPH-dependent glutamate synthase beta subunit-like oxidoreductase